MQVTADPYELRNLAPLPEYKSHVAELDKILLSEVDYPEVAKTLLAENRANVVRWMAAVGDHWEALIRTAYLDFDDDDLRKVQDVAGARRRGGETADAARGRPENR
jgi:hypothetical protein